MKKYIMNQFVIILAAVFLLGTIGMFQAEAGQYDGRWQLVSTEGLHGWYFDVEDNRVYAVSSSDTGAVSPSGDFQYRSNWCHSSAYDSMFEGRLYSDGTGLGNWKCIGTSEYPSSGVWEAVRISGGNTGNDDVVAAAFVGTVITVIGGVVVITIYKITKTKSSSKDSASRQSGIRLKGDTPKDLTEGHRPEHITRADWTGITSEPPTTISEVSYLLKDKMYRLENLDPEEFFKDVGECIEGADGALYTTQHVAKKMEKMFMENVKKNVSEVGGKPEVDKILTYDENLHEYRFKNVTEYAQTMAQILRDELIDVAGKTIPHAKFLSFLVDNFGTEITTPYVCLFYHLQKV